MPHSELAKYVTAARKRGHSDDKIATDLAAGGWDAAAVSAALETGQDRLGPAKLTVPPAPKAQEAAPAGPVQAEAAPWDASVRSLEYIIGFIALALSAVALVALLRSMIDAVLSPTLSSVTGSGSVAPMAIAVLLVAGPVLAYLVMRLRQAEQLNPALRYEPTRRWGTQLTLVASLVVGLGSIMYFLYTLMTGTNSRAVAPAQQLSPFSFGDDRMMQMPVATGHPMLAAFLTAAVTIAVAGGIFYLFWKDEHRG